MLGLQDPLYVALLFGGGVFAGFVNTIAGAGSALTLPLLMLTGMDAGVANATNRVGVVFQSGSATVTFHRKGVRPWRSAATAVGSSLLGAAGGALLATRIAPPALERLFGVVFIFLALVMALRPRWLVPPLTTGGPHPPGPGGHLALLAVGFYGGLFQAGVGIPMALVLVRALGVDLVAANAVKVAVVCVYTTLAVAIFAWAGQVAWAAGGVLAAGGLIGSAVGAHAAVVKGAPLVRKVIVAMLVAAAAKALWPA